MTLRAIVIITAIVRVFVMLQKCMHGKTELLQATPTARQILDERYAWSEIDKETYEQMKKDIR